MTRKLQAALGCAGGSSNGYLCSYSRRLGALPSKPTQARLTSLEGTFAITTDRYADALADFERAVALDQDYDVAQRNLEVARQRRDDVQGSIEARADMITRHHSFQML